MSEIKEIENVLLVEDDDHIRIIVKTSLSKLTTWHVFEANNGIKGLEVAAEVLPDLILLDMMMPGMDGLTMFAELQKIEKLKNIPVIFMTAKVQQEEVNDYIKLGARGVITKPIDPMNLPEGIRAILARKISLHG